jgi:hypothetical protein
MLGVFLAMEIGGDFAEMRGLERRASGLRLPVARSLGKEQRQTAATRLKVHATTKNILEGGKGSR